MTEVVLRSGVAADLGALTDIYNHYVRTSHATFDTEPFTVPQRREWFSHFSTDGPYRLVVATRDGRPVGYASSSRFRPKPAYRTSVETSIYLHPDEVGAGLGARLYEQLLDELRRADAHRAYAGIAVPNAGSAALHQRFGFVKVGTFSQVGFKFGRYIDVDWYELNLTADR
jgi:phosphinothricin acetyltransferase